MLECTRLENCSCTRCKSWDTPELWDIPPRYTFCIGVVQCNCPDCGDTYGHFDEFEDDNENLGADDEIHETFVNDELDEFERVLGELIGLPDNDYLYEKLDELPTRQSFHRR